MLGDSENIFITGSQIPNTNEKTIQSILDIIKDANTFQDVINTLEKDKLIWYFLRHLLKDQEVLDLINPKWKKEFADFNQSIDSRVKELKESTENQEFLIYPKSDNSLEMRFVADDSKQISVEISSVSRASPEGKAINISLGVDNIVTVTRKIRDKRNERHYDFSNSDFCNMIINWEAKDDQGNVIDCSMTVRVGPHGIEEVIGEPKFGGITDEKKVMELVKQNTEVFINGETLYQAFTSIGQNVNNQQKTGKTKLSASAEEPARAEEKNISRSNSLSVDEKNDSGIFTPASVESDTESISDGNKYENDDFENEVKVEEDDHEEFKQKNKQPNEYNEELEQENMQLKKINEELEQENTKLQQVNEESWQDNTQLKKDNKELTERNKRIVAEGDNYILQLETSEEQVKLQVKLLENKLAKKEVELHKAREENEAVVTELVDKIGKLEEDLKDRDNTIKKLGNRITQMTEEIHRINETNEELQRKIDESEKEKERLKTENEELKKDNQERTSALNGKGEELAESQSKLQQPNEKLQKQLKDLTDEHRRLVDDLEQERKKNQQPNVNGKSLLNEMSGDGKDEEIQKLNELAKKSEIQQNKLKKQVKEKNREISQINEKLEEAKKKIESIESQSEQERQELSEKLQSAQEKLKEIRDELNENNELIDKLRGGTVSKESFAKLQSERDKLKHDSIVKEKQLVAINTKLEQAHKEAKDTKEILETLQDQLRQQEEQKATTDEGSQTTIKYNDAKTQTNVEQNEVGTETELPKVHNKGMQTTIVQKNPIIEELRQEIEQLNQIRAENSSLKQSLKKLKEENAQLKQKPKQINASTTTTDKKETKEFGTQTDTEVQDLYDKDGTYLKTELLPPETDLSETRVNAHTDNPEKGPSPGGP